MVLFGEWYKCQCRSLGALWCISLQVDKSAWLLGGEWNKQVYNKYTFTARLLGC